MLARAKKKKKKITDPYLAFDCSGMSIELTTKQKCEFLLSPKWAFVHHHWQRTTDSYIFHPSVSHHPTARHSEVSQLPPIPWMWKGSPSDGHPRMLEEVFRVACFCQTFGRPKPPACCVNLVALYSASITASALPVNTPPLPPSHGLLFSDTGAEVCLLTPEPAVNLKQHEALVRGASSLVSINSKPSFLFTRGQCWWPTEPTEEAWIHSGVWCHACCRGRSLPGDGQGAAKLVVGVVGLLFPSGLARGSWASLLQEAGQHCLNAWPPGAQS